MWGGSKVRVNQLTLAVSHSSGGIGLTDYAVGPSALCPQPNLWTLPDLNSLQIPSDSAKSAHRGTRNSAASGGGTRIACTHGLFTAGALARLSGEPGMLEVVATNTVPVPPEKRVAKLGAISIAPAMAEAIRRIHNGESVSALFHAE